MTIQMSYEEIKIPKPTRSSGSEGILDDENEKKRRRMESNKESARRSRQKKQNHMDDLMRQLATFTRQNDQFEKKINEITSAFSALEAQNTVLMSEKARLTARLEELENMIEIADVVRGSASSEINNGGFCDALNEDLLMKPWQLPCFSLPIDASSGFRGFDFDV